MSAEFRKLRGHNYRTQQLDHTSYVFSRDVMTTSVFEAHLLLSDHDVPAPHLFFFKGNGDPRQKKKIKETFQTVTVILFSFRTCVHPCVPVGTETRGHKKTDELSGIFQASLSLEGSPLSGRRLVKHKPHGRIPQLELPIARLFPQSGGRQVVGRVCACVEICVDICGPHVAGHRACHATSIFVPPCAGAVVSRDVFGRHTIEPRHHP